jgi:hypothetical protein
LLHEAHDVFLRPFKRVNGFFNLNLHEHVIIRYGLHCAEEGQRTQDGVNLLLETATFYALSQPKSGGVIKGENEYFIYLGFHWSKLSAVT